MIRKDRQVGATVAVWLARAVLALAVVLSVGAGAPSARAQAPAKAQTVQHTVVGVGIQTEVPPGWTTQLDSDAITYFPPAGKVRGKFSCALSAASYTGTMNAKDLLVAYLNSQQQQKPWAAVGTPTDAKFFGVNGALMTLSGTNAGESLMTIYVASIVNGVLYVFVMDGTINDLSGLATDGDTIVSSAMFAKGNGATTNCPAGFGNCNEAHPAGGSAPDPIHDPAFGISVDGLDANWQAEGGIDGYMISSSSPQATFKITYEPFASKDEYQRGLGKFTQGKLGAESALVVETQDKDGSKAREYHILKGDHAIVVRFSSVSFKAAEDGALKAFAKALKVGDSSVQWVDQKEGGVSLSLASSADMVLPKPWKLDQLGAGRAVFKYHPDKGDTIWIDLRVLKPLSERDDPIAIATSKRSECELGQGKWEEGKAMVMGASRAVRTRCVSSSSARVVVVARGSVDGKPVYLKVLTQAQPKTSAAAEKAIADFLTHIRFAGE